MSDDSSEARCRRIRASLAELSTLCADGNRAVERLIGAGRSAIAAEPVGQTIMLGQSADAGEWSKLIEELETRLAGASAAERAAREESRRLETEIQELRRAKRDLERDSRNARHELENLQASLDEDAEEREFARRRLETRVVELEAENERLKSGRSVSGEPESGAGAPHAVDQPDSDENSPVRRALKSLGKKRPD